MTDHQLWLISLPIGNDLDITEHAKLKLQELGEVWCEDTRTFKIFCDKHQIDYSSKNIVSFHDHSDENRINKFLSSIQNHSIGYVSEAGSPYISDPAHNLVQACYDNEITVKSAPGACSIIMALELSGLPAIPFSFHGFLPRNQSGKKKLYDSWKTTGGTHICFEGVSRIKATLNDMVEYFDDQTQFVVLREMSKKFETVYRFNSSQWIQVYDDLVEKGEFVILTYLPKSKNSISNQVEKILEDIRKKGAKPKLLSKLLSEMMEEDASEVYNKYFKN